MANQGIAKQLKGYRLTTAEVIYHLPGHPSLLQIFIWQTMDIAPTFPKICKFLDHWEKKLRRQTSLCQNNECKPHQAK